MKFFHISDLHIGLKLLNRDLKEDQIYILDQIVEKAAEEAPDALVIAGDIYDKAVPAAEAVEVFDRFISMLTQRCPQMVIMMISGNHDSAPRIDCFRSILSRQNVYMIGRPPQEPEERIAQVRLTDAWGEVCFYLLPFVKPSVVRRITGMHEDGSHLSYAEALQTLIDREAVDTTGRNVLVSHQFYLPEGQKAEEIDRTESEIRTVGNIDQVPATVLAPFDYAALGHIHRPMPVGCDVYRYSGTPLACSVSEAGQEKGILVVEMEAKGTVRVRTLPLRPLHQIRVIRGTLEEVLHAACEDYVKVILTDKVDLEVIDMQDRVRAAFPRLLEIQREVQRRTAERSYDGTVTQLTPLELCLAFMKELDTEEQKILQDVINQVKGGA